MESLENVIFQTEGSIYNYYSRKKLRTGDDGKPSFVMGTDRWSKHDKTDNTEGGGYGKVVRKRKEKRF